MFEEVLFGRILGCRCPDERSVWLPALLKTAGSFLYVSPRFLPRVCYWRWICGCFDRQNDISDHCICAFLFISFILFHTHRRYVVIIWILPNVLRMVEITYCLLLFGNSGCLIYTLNMMPLLFHDGSPSVCWTVLLFFLSHCWHCDSWILQCVWRVKLYCLVVGLIWGNLLCGFIWLILVVPCVIEPWLNVRAHFIRLVVLAGICLSCFIMICYLNFLCQSLDKWHIWSLHLCISFLFFFQTDHLCVVIIYVA